MDMSSKEGCCKFIEKLNGELYGFIHSAGVLQDSMLMNLTWEKFETVFQCLVLHKNTVMVGCSEYGLAIFIFMVRTHFCRNTTPECWILSTSVISTWSVRSKHHAALFLHYALEQYPQKDFRFMWNFSSTSVYGNMGQLNYSGSNSFLDVLTRHRKVGITLKSWVREWMMKNPPPAGCLGFIGDGKLHSYVGII